VLLLKLVERKASTQSSVPRQEDKRPAADVRAFATILARLLGSTKLRLPPAVSKAVPELAILHEACCGSNPAARPSAAQARQRLLAISRRQVGQTCIALCVLSTAAIIIEQFRCCSALA
jgi:hypothetical protein